ncbi:hypothetical protein NQ317_009681 [Molorchus minor]|uniref:Cadherin domain-containing protein n=1 Tax=Molorchus minor TaxID=1323400 RepID=A0ABQ9JHC0_9CUCU|nr:hypothetical protein NQ317_009681 [Molorchus minor]
MEVHGPDNSLLVYGNCDITGIDDNDYQTVFTLNINDTQIETNILSTPYTGTLEVQTYTSQDYFIVTTEDGNFVIKTTAGFGNFDEDTAKQSNTFAIVSLDCTFTCSSGTSTLLIQVLVTDINSHAPEFDQDDYVYSVASPMMPLTDFSIYGDKSLTAKDIDFSNQDITFTVTPDDFSISTISTSDSKSYTASFAARNVIQLTGNRTYTITATDSGTNPGPLTTSTTITLTVDESTSLDIPSFESSSYSFNYTVNDTSPKLTELDGPITIVTNKPSDLTEPELTGDYSQYFEAVVNEQTSTIEVSAIDLLPDDVGSFVIVTLSVSTDNRASTSLIVYLAESAESVVQFSSHYYTGSYSDLTNSITLDNPITVTSSSTPAVKLAGEYNEHFSIKYEQSTSSCLITVKSNLTINETQASSYITLTITATVGKYSDTANLLLVLPEYELKFTEPLYEATYNDNTVTIDGNSSIGFTTEIEDVTITIGGNYQEYFGIAYKAATKQWSLIITKSLSNDTLKTEKEIVLILTATDVYKNVAESVVTIQLPKVETNAPEFSESYYLANYSAYINNSTVALNNNIAIINRDDQSKINITLDSYSENFGIEYDNSLNKWIFKVISPLNEDIFLSKNEVIITLLAEEENNSNKGKAVVVINWISEAAPTFSQAYYIGVYPVNGTGVVEVQPDITFTNVGDPSEIKMRLDTANEELVVALTAENDNGKEGQSVLIIQLPNAQKAPEFSNIYYTAKYPESGSGIIELDPAISFKNAENPDSITVTLDNYVDNFEVSYGVDGWYVQIKEGLSPTTLSQNTELVITLVATESGVDSTGESVLIMRLPSSGNATNIQFSEAYYIAEYPDTATSSIELESPIEIINVDDITKVKLTLDNYIENFEIIYQSNQWHINIKKELDKNVLYNNAELVMSLIATEVNNTDKGYSALVIKLPTGINGTAPKFSEAYYKGTYPENGTGIIEILNPIGFTNVDDPTKVGIVLDNFSDNFEIVYSSNMWHINIKKPLESSVLTKNVELVITMVATKTGYTAQGESALVLTLPGATIGPKFAATYYIAKYPKNSTGIIEFDTPYKFLKYR